MWHVQYEDVKLVGWHLLQAKLRHVCSSPAPGWLNAQDDPACLWHVAQVVGYAVWLGLVGAV